jgi:hypothetical protein
VRICVVEPKVGIEPTACRLRIDCSTAELLRLAKIIPSRPFAYQAHPEIPIRQFPHRNQALYRCRTQNNFNGFGPHAEFAQMRIEGTAKTAPAFHLRTASWASGLFRRACTRSAKSTLFVEWKAEPFGWEASLA